MKRIFCGILLAAFALVGRGQVHHDAEVADTLCRDDELHVKLSEVVVNGVTGQSLLRESPLPFMVVSQKELTTSSSTNIIDAIAHMPGISQLTTGSGISKPVIRGLGYNRVAVVSDGIRQEGQQWGDEHGVELDAASVGSVEILKGPASLMYGSDALAGVVVFRPYPVLPQGTMRTNVQSEYQTNNGLFAYSADFAGNKSGTIWDVRYSEKYAHAYKNKVDGYVPGSQFSERAASALVGRTGQWGRSSVKLSYYHLTPSIIEGERDEATGELEYDERVGLKSYKKAAPFQQINHYKAVWDNQLFIGDGRLNAVFGYQQNRRQEFEGGTHPQPIPKGGGARYEVRGARYGVRGARYGVRDTGREDLEAELDFQLHTVNYDVRYISGDLGGWKLSTGVNGMWQQSLNKGEEALIPAYKLFDFGIFTTATRTWERWTMSGGVRYDRRKLRTQPLPKGGEELEGCEVRDTRYEVRGARYGVRDTRCEVRDARKEEREEQFSEFQRGLDGVSGSIGATYCISNQAHLRLNASRGFRAPNLSELGSNGVHEGSLRYEQGNQNLRPEFSWQLDAGIDYSSHALTAQLSLFANHIDNFIFLERMTAAEEQQLHEGNEESVGYDGFRYTAGTARLWGGEASVVVHPFRRLHIENTFSYVATRLLHQPSDSRYLPTTPQPRWTLDVRCDLLRECRHVANSYASIGLECYLKQDRVFTANDTETPSPSYTLLNAAAGTDVLHCGKRLFSVYLTATNLLDKAYQNHLSRLKYAGLNPVTGRRGIYNMGRNIGVKVVVPLVSGKR